MIQFLSEPLVALRAGRLEYRHSERSLAFVPIDSGPGTTKTVTDATSLSLGTIQLEVDIESRLVLQVWGYHPREAWIPGLVQAPEAVRGGLRVHESTKLARGVSVPITCDTSWVTTFDPASGWLSIHCDDVEPPRTVVEFAESTLAGLSLTRLVALWLRPLMT